MGTASLLIDLNTIFSAETFHDIGGSSHTSLKGI